MSKVLSRPRVAQMALELVRQMEDDPNIREETRFWEDLRVDRKTRRTYYGPIRDKVEGAGSRIVGIGPGDFEALTSVKDLIDLVFGAQPA